MAAMDMEALSLPVPSVQRLAKENPSVIPSRYIRSSSDDDIIKSPATEKTRCDDVPVIDMQKLLYEESLLGGVEYEESLSSELEKLHVACRDWGFFQMINHGVECSVVEKTKREVQEFFNLPLEEKERKYGQVEGEKEGFGQHFVVSEEQKLDWADMFYIKTLPTHLRSPRLFPNLPQAFRDTIEVYSGEVHKVAMKVLSLLAKKLGIEGDEMRKLFEEGMQSMRMNYYPPCPHPELVMGLSPHSDPGGLTILLQVNQTKGLEIKKDGVWIPIVPIPNAFIVNVGDSVEIFTNGIYRSIEHRGIVNPEKERVSIATFHSPNMDAELGPATNLITPQTPSKFKRISVHDFYRLFFKCKLDGKSRIESLRVHDQ